MLKAILLNSILYKLSTLNKQFIYLKQIYKESTVHKNGLFISSISSSNWGVRMPVIHEISLVFKKSHFLESLVLCLRLW
jgi:hypothetical protein